MQKAERKGTQYTFLHTVKARADKGLRERATFYFPNWWYGAPMAVFSFLEKNDLTGKRVVLFCSHGTGGPASGGKDISVVLTDSQVESNVLGVNRDDIAESQEKINDWLKEIGY